MPDFTTKTDAMRWKFFERINMGTAEECWTWTGHHHVQSGRPMVTFRGRTMHVTRALWIILGGGELESTDFNVSHL